MPLPGLALGISAGLGALKFGSGLLQQRKGAKIRRAAQRKYEANPFQIPEEVLRALRTSEVIAAQTELPGQDVLEEQIAGATGGALQSMREAALTPQELMEGATGAFQNLYVAPMRDIAIRGAERYDRNQAQLLNQLGQVGQYRTEEWKQNILAPYQAAMQTAGQMSAAGQQNLFSGVSDIAGGVANFAMAGGFGGGANVLPPAAPTVNTPVVDAPVTLPGFTPRLNNTRMSQQDNLIQYYG